MGFEQAGFDVVWTNEIHPLIARMYYHGMTSWRQSLGLAPKECRITQVADIRLLHSSKVLHEAFPKEQPAIFGVVGGSPCPDFSVAGLNRGESGDHGQLTKTFVNIIRKIKPSFFLLENVPGLFRTAAHRKFLVRVERWLEKAGYNIDRNLLNALEYGVPQDRQRLFLVGIRKGLVKEKLGRKVSYGARGWFHWPSPKYPNAKVAYAWPDIVRKGETPSLPEGVPLELTVGHFLNGNNSPALYSNSREYFKPYSKKFLTTLEGATRQKSFKRLHRHRYSPAACYGNNEVHLHPWKNRRLSVREVLRIQGVPDSYVVPEDIPLSRKFKTIANGVPVPLAYEVAAAIRRFLNS